MNSSIITRIGPKTQEVMKPVKSGVSLPRLRWEHAINEQGRSPHECLLNAIALQAVRDLALPPRSLKAEDRITAWQFVAEHTDFYVDFGVPLAKVRSLLYRMRVEV